MNKALIIFSILLTINSCKKDDPEFFHIEKEFNKFPVVHNIEGEVVEHLKDKEITFYRVYLIDSLLIIKDVYNQKKCIHILNKNNFNLLASIGEKGKGPFEVINPATISYNKENNEIWLIDASKFVAFKFDLKEALNNASYLPEKAFNIDKQLLPFWDMVWINKDTFAVVNTNTNNLISYYNRNGNKIKEFGDKFHKKEKDAPPIGYKLSCSARLGYSKKQDKLIMSFKYFDKLIGFNLEKKEYFILTGPSHYSPKLLYKRGLLSTKKIKQMRGKVIVHNNYIFSTYFGKNRWSIINGEPVVNNYDELHIFGLNGDPIARLKLDRQITEFVIDYTNNRIIAYDFLNDEVVLFKTHRNPCLKQFIQ